MSNNDKRPWSQEELASSGFISNEGIWISPSSISPSTTSMKTQIGGTHYKGLVIEPFEYAQKNKLGFGEGSIVKYVSRHRDKNGIEDLRKAKHYLELLAELEYGEEL